MGGWFGSVSTTGEILNGIKLFLQQSRGLDIALSQRWRESTGNCHQNWLHNYGNKFTRTLTFLKEKLYPGLSEGNKYMMITIKL